MKRAFMMAAATSLVALQAAAQEVPSAGAEFIGIDGEVIGSATLTSAMGGVLIEVEVNELPAGQWVAFHVHENGECDPETSFGSAGGHFNPDGSEHGFHVEGGAHAGDMPNQYVGNDGVLRTHVLNAMITLGGGEADVAGLALVIHEEADDYRSQPAGDAGPRIACAVIQ